MDNKQIFNDHFNKEPEHIFFSPGRVNLIGEHIDYNGGLVMPCAIEQGTYLLVAANNEGVFRLRSANFKEQLEISIDADFEKIGDNWFNYPLGVIKSFKDKGIVLKGLDLFFVGNIPIGSGLSSSASIGIVTAFALNSIFHANISRLELVRLVKSVENKFIGVNCGIMDQYAVAFGEQHKALLIDCEKQEHQAVDCYFGDNVIAIINTNKQRTLSDSKYNERVGECKTALEALQQELNIENLCSINTETFNKYSHLITDEVVLKRARHVVEENERVHLAAAALSNADLQQFGQLLYASHHSLSHLYEVSGRELDTIVEYCKINADVLGARMTGAGFGGCAIALVKKSGYQKFKDELTDFYKQKIGYAPDVYQTDICEGVRELDSVTVSQSS